MIALLMILIAAVYTDYRQNRIPNWIIVFGLISGCFISYMYGGIGMLLEGLLGMVLPIVLLYPVFVIGGMGAGDLKLFAVVGSYLGIKGITISFVSAFVVGADKSPSAYIVAIFTILVSSYLCILTLSRSLFP